MGLRSHITLVTSLGLAELVIRTSLDAAKQATGLERTVLHATESEALQQMIAH